MIELELPYPPSVNNYKSVGRTVTTQSGKVYQQRINSKSTMAFYYEVWIKVKGLKCVKRIEMPIPAKISLEMHVELYPPDKRRRDVDNGLKTLLDSLVKGGLIEDDSQISRLIVEKKGIMIPAKVIVRIKELT